MEIITCITKMNIDAQQADANVNHNTHIFLALKKNLIDDIIKEISEQISKLSISGESYFIYESKQEFNSDKEAEIFCDKLVEIIKESNFKVR